MTIPYTFTIDDLPGAPAYFDYCGIPLERENAGVLVVESCRHPTSRIIRLDMDQFEPGDPRADHTVYPICRLHEIRAFLDGGLPDGI